MSAAERGAILVSDAVEERWGSAIGDAAPDMPRVVVARDGVAGDPASAEVAFFSGDLFPERTREFVVEAIRAVKTGALRWYHTFSAGVDNPFFEGLLDRGVRLTTSSGAMAVPIAHTVMLYVLAFSRDLRAWLDAQARRSWEPGLLEDLQQRVLGVVGLGSIGLEVARLGGAFGMRVVGVRRTPTGDEPCETWPLERLTELLALADYVVIALPLNEDTRGLIDARALSGMKHEAVLVNIARGEIVVESALVRALERGELRGAALDVFEEEPLPQASPLWKLPNVIVTPHSSGTTLANQDRVARIFLDNLALYRADEPMRNEVGGGRRGGRV